MSAPNAIKQRDLQPCRLCGRGVMHAGAVTFHRVTVERFVVNVPAVRRQHGLELMVGPLAQFMGPDRDLAQSHDDLRHMALVCETCAAALQLSVFELTERLQTREAVTRDGGA
jgi:hypothetical protein